MELLKRLLFWKTNNKTIRAEPFSKIKLKYFNTKKEEDAMLLPSQHCHVCGKKYAVMGSAFHAEDGDVEYVCLDCDVDNIMRDHGWGNYHVAKSRRLRKLDVPYLFQEMFIDRFIKSTGRSGIDDLNDIILKESAVLSSKIYDKVYYTPTKKNRIEELEDQEDIEKEFEDVLDRLTMDNGKSFSPSHTDKETYAREYKSEKLSYSFTLPQGWVIKDAPGTDHVLAGRGIGNYILAFRENTQDAGLDWRDYIIVYVTMLRRENGLVFLLNGKPSEHQIQIQSEGNIALAEFESPAEPDAAIKFFFVKSESDNKVAVVNYIRPKKGFDSSIDEEVISTVRGIKFIT